MNTTTSADLSEALDLDGSEVLEEVVDPADGSVLATLVPGGARAVPVEGVTVGPVADVNGISVQPLARGWGSPATYYVVASHTPTVPLTRGEVARLAQVLIDALTTEVA